MNNFELSGFKHIHFVGIGGISMYLLALYCRDLGLEVSGSDIRHSKYTDICKDRGVKIFVGHRAKNIAGADLVVYTSAIDKNNVELVFAQNNNIKTIERADLVKYICSKFKCVIGIAGSHGKTTTCAMLYHILRESGKKVSCHIGADIEDARLNPGDDYLVLECCEYNRCFLHFDCDITAVLNVDNDHLDCYQNMYNIRNAFNTFLKSGKTRFVFDNSTTKHIRCKSFKILLDKIIDENKFVYNGRNFILNNVYGNHNINNACMAIAIALHLGLSYTKIYKAIKSFKPAGRRCQVLGNINGADIITDYAHHPSEIECLYSSLKSKYNNIYIIFQPHTYSRTKILIHDFVKVFQNIDNLCIYKEYPAREPKTMGYSAKYLSQQLNKSVYIKNFNNLKKYIKQLVLNQNDCIVFIGAGDINEVGARLAR